jgi:hypothetical protein
VAHLFLALRAEQAGRREDTRAHYEACLRLGLRGTVEHAWAEQRRTRLDEEER